MRVYIFDFGASLNYTHHTQYILSQVNFIKRNYSKAKIIVFLPFGSEINTGSIGSPDRTIKLLLPITHFVKTNFTKLPTYMLYIWSKICKSIFVESNRKFFSKIQLAIKFIIVLPYLIFFRIRKNSLIIFPTSCPQSLFLIRRLELIGTKHKIHLRFGNTAEVRQPFGSKSLVLKFLKDSHAFKNIKIICSFETIDLLQDYSKHTNSVNFHFSRPPSFIDRSKDHGSAFKNIPASRNDSVNVLVLGRPDDLGRQEFLETFLLELKSRSSELIKSVSIKLTSAPKRSHSISTLSNSAFQVEFIPYREPFHKMLNLLEHADFLVLLYNIEMYKLNHSAMFLMACDLEVPIIVGEGMSFSQELVQYKLGSLFSSQANLVDRLFDYLVDNHNNYGFLDYYLAREVENLEILEKLGFKIE
jgi:hypothetical protein